MTPEEFVAHARTWVGTPFHHQGRSRAGVDCVGLPVAIGMELQMVPAGFRAPHNYGRQATGELTEMMERHCVQVFKPEPGLGVVFRFPKERWGRHVGILTGPTIIHADAVLKRVVEHGFTGRWVRMAETYWRFPLVQYPP